MNDGGAATQVMSLMAATDWLLVTPDSPQAQKSVKKVKIEAFAIKEGISVLESIYLKQYTKM